MQIYTKLSKELAEITYHENMQPVEYNKKNVCTNGCYAKFLKIIWLNTQTKTKLINIFNETRRENHK